MEDDLHFADIYNAFCRNYPDFVPDVQDYRPYTPPFTDEFRFLSIVIWMKDGSKKRYDYVTGKLYPIREMEM